MVTFEIVADMRFRTILSTDTRTIELSVLLDDYLLRQVILLLANLALRHAHDRDKQKVTHA